MKKFYMDQNIIFQFDTFYLLISCFFINTKVTLLFLMIKILLKSGCKQINQLEVSTNTICEGWMKILPENPNPEAIVE